MTLKKSLVYYGKMYRIGCTIVLLSLLILNSPVIAYVHDNYHQDPPYENNRVISIPKMSFHTGNLPTATPDTVVSIITVDPSVFPNISLKVNVNTTKGNNGELTKESFTVDENNISQEIQSLVFIDGNSSGKADIIFIFDDTGSMSDEIDGMKANVDNFTDKVAASGIDAQYSLITFKDDVTIRQGWTSNSTTLKTAVNSLYADGGDDTPEVNLDAIMQALQFEYRSGAQKIIIDITDAPTHYEGDGSSFSRYSIEQVESAIQSNGIIFIAVSPDEGGISDMKTIAGAAGGMWINIYGSDFQVIFNQLVTTITTLYQIDYTTTNNDFDGSEREIKLQVSDPDEGIESTFSHYKAPGKTPFISSINPTNITAGSPQFSLVVNGQNFTENSSVRWNGVNKATTFIDQANITAIISALDVISAGTVDVTIFDSKRGTSNAIVFNIISPPPTPLVANFTATPTIGIAPFTVQFYDNSTGSPDWWLWDFGDGNTSEGEPNPIWEYSKPGIYNVSLTVFHGSSENTTVKPEFIFVSESKGLADSAWPKYHRDLNNSGQSLYNGPQTNNTLWIYTVEDEIWSSPVIGADGTIYFGSDDKNLYALNPNGTLKWNYSTGSYIDCSPAIGADGTIYFGSCDKNIYAVNPDGTLKWNYTTLGYGLSSPAIGADGTIYIGSDKIIALNPNGTLKWACTGGVYGSSPAIGTDGTIYIGSWDNNPIGYLNALNPNGTLKWNYTTGRIGDLFYDSPAIGADGTIYIGCDNGNDGGNIYALNPDGTLKWNCTTRNPIRSSPAIAADGTIYVGSENRSLIDNKVYAIYPNGTLKWDYATGAFIGGSAAIGADGTIYIGSFDKNVYALNPDGTVKWNYTTGNFVFSSPAIAADGTLYIGNHDGKIYAFKDTGAPAANFSATPTTGTAPLTVQFTDSSTGSITTRFWDFGDGKNSTDENPIHTYTSPGNYSVNLTVTGSGGSSSLLKSNYISVGTAVYTIYVGDDSVDMPGDQTVIPVILTRAPDTSIWSYKYNITIDNPAIAEITEIQFPDWIDLTDIKPSLPGTSINIQGRNLAKINLTSLDNVVLANLVVKGKAVGESWILVDKPTVEWETGILNPEDIYTVSGSIVVNGLGGVAVSSVSPTSGLRGKTVSLILLGSNFTANSSVNLTRGVDNIHATNVISTSGNTITCKVAIPPDATTGQYDVVVTNNNGKGSLPYGFTVLSGPAPVISSLNPNTMSPNASWNFTITGRNFNRSGVFFYGPHGDLLTTHTFSSTSNSRIIGWLELPANVTLGTWDVWILNFDGGLTKKSKVLNVKSWDPPTILNIQPGSIYKNTTASLVLTGSNFQPGLTTVFFNMTGQLDIPLANLTVVSPTKITGTVSVPGGPLEGKWNAVMVTTDGGTGMKSNALTVKPWPKPTISAVSPSKTFINSTVQFTIGGTNFQDNTTVFFNRTGSPNLVPDSFTVVSTKKITGVLTIPLGTTTDKWNAVVTTPDGGTTVKPKTFKISTWPKPIPGLITPSSGPVGTPVNFTLAGTNFQPDATAVVFNKTGSPDVSATDITVISQTKLTGYVTLPATGKWNLFVTTVDGGKSVKKSNAFKAN